MSLLSFNQLAQSFGAADIFKNASGNIEPGSKIGLVGPNGSGKTSLLLLITGVQKVTVGVVAHRADLRIGYLRQEAVQAFYDATHTVWEEMLRPFAGVHAMEAELRSLETDMADPDKGDQLDDILTRYGEIQERFEAIGGYDYEVRIKATLEGLGFSADMYATPLHHLSGGQKTRALLARLLLERPDLLVLDEPTNHLDAGAVEWLEHTLRNYSGAVLIVSHDRYFLDVVVDTIWELNHDKVDSFRGNYSAYLRQRQERWEYTEKLYTQEMSRLHEEMEYIRKNMGRTATNAQAVGRLRRLSRDLVAMEELGLVDYKKSKQWMDTGLGGIRPYTVAEAEGVVKRLKSPNTRRPPLNVRLKTTYRSAESVLHTADLLVGYPDHVLFRMPNTLLQRGETAALIGGNGTGKTTLLKTLLGELEPLEGAITTGNGLKVGYFAQAHDDLNFENTVLDELIRHQPMGMTEARKLLAQYLFRSDDVFKPVGKLSGGERGKLALAVLAAKGANFLLLDEPTNHLDIPAQEALQEVLEQFEGTILLVSHDRYLIDRLATQIWALEQGLMHVFKGEYAEYVAARDAGTLDDHPLTTRLLATSAGSTPVVTINASRPAPVPAQVSQTDMQIHSIEGAIKELERLIERSNAAGQADTVQRLHDELTAQQTKLSALLAASAERA